LKEYGSMKRTILAIAILAFLSAAPGCLQRNTRQGEGQGGCGPGCGGLLSGLGGGPVSQEIHATQGWRHQAPEMGPAGPPTAATAYPYYTLRGPRDFLTDNPPSIGN
jgi:predicted small secreted protein